jgi:hypothetical protein
VQLIGTLDGVTWLGPLAFGPGEGLTVVGGLTVKTAAANSPGSIDMSAGGDTLLLTSGETLDNAILNFSGDGDHLVDATTGGTLTLGSGFTLDSSGTNNFFNDDQNNTTALTMLSAGLINVSGGTLTDLHGNLVNSGTITLGGGGTLQFDLSSGVGAPAAGITNSGSITIDAGGVLNLAGSGRLNNSGSVTIGAGGELAATFIDANTGTIAVGSGGLLSVANFSNSGIVSVDNGGTLSTSFLFLQ